MFEKSDSFITNTGDTAGKEVVQVHGQQPYTESDRENGIEKASVQLVGFGKTDILDPQKSEVVEVSVNREELAAYDAYVNKTYILEEGIYYLVIGSDAHNAVNNILAAKGKTTADGMDYDGDADKVYTLSASRRRIPPPMFTRRRARARRSPTSLKRRTSTTTGKIWSPT